MHLASAHVVGASLEAFRQVSSGESLHAVNIAGGLHHAMPDRASGFCIYNDCAVGIKQLFVLTTMTAHWFRERGFVEKTLADLPEEKRLVYNLQRRSKIFAKTL